MAALDFKEIPKADQPSGRQDAFELFARDALAAAGFRILLDPSRGADGGKDLIIEEHRVGPLSETKVKWLVSCKHLAHSGASVTPALEINVTERVKAAGCDGFLGFYSTLPSSGLSNLLNVPGQNVRLLDHEAIERLVLDADSGIDIVKRYFPLSYKKMKPQPAQLYTMGEPVVCDRCGKDLFNPPSGIWVLWSEDSKLKGPGDHYIDMHFACKGKCDEVLEARIRAKHSARGYIQDGWDDVDEMLLPTVFIKKIMAFFNGFASGDTFEPEVLEKLKHFLLTSFPHVSRNLTPDEEKTLAQFQKLPSAFGGLG